MSGAASSEVSPSISSVSLCSPDSKLRNSLFNSFPMSGAASSEFSASISSVSLRSPHSKLTDCLFNSFPMPGATSSELAPSISSLSLSPDSKLADGGSLLSSVRRSRLPNSKRMLAMSLIIADSDDKMGLTLFWFCCSGGIFSAIFCNSLSRSPKGTSISSKHESDHFSLVFRHCLK